MRKINFQVLVAAAELGISDAQYHLGNIFDEGVEIPRACT
jgi:TPR repeat protein